MTQESHSPAVLQGQLHDHGLSDALQLLARQGHTGVLSAYIGRARYVLGLEQGCIVHSMAWPGLKEQDVTHTYALMHLLFNAQRGTYRFDRNNASLLQLRWYQKLLFKSETMVSHAPIRVDLAMLKILQPNK